MSGDHAHGSPNVVVLPVEGTITVTPNEEKVPQSKGNTTQCFGTGALKDIMILGGDYRSYPC